VLKKDKKSQRKPIFLKKARQNLKKPKKNRQNKIKKRKTPREK
jgi:hypothetical protein